MSMTRRTFLGTSMGAAAGLALGRSAMTNVDVHPQTDLPQCLLLDLNSNCALRESLRGYEQALSASEVAPARWSQAMSLNCRLVIVPGAGVMEPAAARALSKALNLGAKVILESGAGFLSQPEFEAHQKMLARHFDVLVRPPVDLWAEERARSSEGIPPRKSGQGKTFTARVPYVDYHWPHGVKVRDFSRVVPLAPNQGQTIGLAAGLPVGMRRRWGNGDLVYLGSPLGPALVAGDAEATRWLRAVICLA